MGEILESSLPGYAMAMLGCPCDSTDLLRDGGFDPK